LADHSSVVSLPAPSFPMAIGARPRGNSRRGEQLCSEPAVFLCLL